MEVLVDGAGCLIQVVPPQVVAKVGLLLRPLQGLDMAAKSFASTLPFFQGLGMRPGLEHKFAFLLQFGEVAGDGVAARDFILCHGDWGRRFCVSERVGVREWKWEKEA